MKEILNFININHKVTEDQRAQFKELGYELVELRAADELRKELSNLSSDADLEKLAAECRTVIERSLCSAVLLPIGSPVFMATLFSGRLLVHTEYFFSHTDREAVEKELPDGSIEKKMVFKHTGFHVLDTRRVRFYPYRRSTEGKK